MHALPPAAASQTGRGILLMLLAVLSFSLLDATAKDLTARYPFGMILWARLAVQVAVVAAILRGALPALARTSHPRLHLLRAFAQIGAGGFFFASLPFIGLAEATALADTSPILITLGAALFLGERLGPRRIAGVAAAMIGALVIIRPGAAVFTPAALLPLGCAVCYAINALITRSTGRRENMWTAMILTPAIAVIAVSCALPFFWVTPAAADLPRFLAIGLFGTVSQIFLIRSFALAEASAVAPFTYAGIVFATLWGILFFGEWPDRATVAGALVIVLAGLYVWHRETRAAERR